MCLFESISVLHVTNFSVFFFTNFTKDVVSIESSVSGPELIVPQINIIYFGDVSERSSY